MLIIQNGLMWIADFNPSYGKNIGYERPKLGENCTAKRGINTKLDCHYHCPHCGAIANLHFLGAKCTGCDLCIFGEHYPAIIDYSTE
jgi:hypothetical protein